MSLEVHPLTPDRWGDLAVLFDRLWGQGARAAFQQVVETGPAPGLLAYRDARPVGWCAVAPREQFPRILRSPVLRPVDEAPACWAVVCFYVERAERRGGVAAALLDAAVEFAAAGGAEVVEGYPKDPGARHHANELFVGSTAMFRRAGFREVGRRSPTRPIMRRGLTAREPVDQAPRRPRRARR